ncbi:MAG TPA: AIR synthase-related protein, partial [Turneriella sp.]|nr:AIR synthase-related protein [Turneriella sp.]
DAVLGLASSGLHSNGFSLVRKIFAELEKNSPAEFQTMAADREKFIATWLAPTRIYKEIPTLLQQAEIKGIAHITGGGIHENLPRAIAEGLGAVIENAEPFRLQAAGLLEQHVAREKLFHTFNMGTGLILIASEGELEKIRKVYPEAAVMGRLAKGQGVSLKL